MTALFVVLMCLGFIFGGFSIWGFANVQLLVGCAGATCALLCVACCTLLTLYDAVVGHFLYVQRRMQVEDSRRPGGNWGLVDGD
jgi:hypothetical protein